MIGGMYIITRNFLKRAKHVLMIQIMKLHLESKIIKFKDESKR
jgi:hypothetical protein